MVPELERKEVKVTGGKILKCLQKTGDFSYWTREMGKHSFYLFFLTVPSAQNLLDYVDQLLSVSE